MTAMNENIELMMPIKATPYDHQKKAFAFACDKFGVFDERLKSRGTALLMEMGTGKTIVSIAVAGCMYQYGKVNRVLVVAPLSILGVWEEEFEKFADFPYSLTILKGTVAKKKEQLAKLPDEDLQVVVVNYESAWRLEKELLAYNADLIIADEAHKLKENRSKQSKGLHTLGDKARFKLLLTGTVITKQELRKWVNYALKNDALILYDAAYQAYIRDPEIPRSIYEIRGARKCAIEFHSYSKTAGFTGVRCGYTIVPKDVTVADFEGERHSVHQLWNRRQCTKFNGASYISQRAAEAIYTPEGKEQIQATIDYYMANARLMLDTLRRLGYEVYGGENAPYVWMKTPDGTSSWQFFEELLYGANVVCTPGVGFGPSGEGYVRFTAFGSHETTKEALTRIENWTNSH